MSEDEKNILYVAVTRAKRYLNISHAVFKLLAASQFHFEEIVHVGGACTRCEKPIGDAALYLSCKGRHYYSIR